MKLIVRNPFVNFALVGLLLSAIVSVVGLEYDDGSASGAFWWISAFFTIPYHLAGQLVSLVWDGDGSGRTALDIALGMGFCALLDVGVQKLRSRQVVSELRASRFSDNLCGKSCALTRYTRIRETMFDHVVFGVSDYAASKAFFLKALEPLGVAIASEGPLGVELCCPDSDASLCIRRVEEAATHLHLAFKAANRGQVESFYKAAIEAGAKDNGAPGLRPQYHSNYYAAFVIGPDGHNIEVVCHQPEA